MDNGLELANMPKIVSIFFWFLSSLLRSDYPFFVDATSGRRQVDVTCSEDDRHGEA